MTARRSVLGHLTTAARLAALLLAACTCASAQDGGPREFRLISTVKLATLEKELNEAARQGFRLEQLAQGLVTLKTAAVLSRAASPPAAPAYEYKVVDWKHLKETKDELAGQGFEFRGAASLFRLMSFNAVAVFERRVGATAGNFEYEVITSAKEKALQVELDHAVSAGFRPVGLLGAAGSGTVIFLRRSKDNPAAEMGTREYKLLDTSRAATLEKEMNAAAAEGWRFETASLDLTVLMSRPVKPQPIRYEYQVLSTQRVATLEKELREQARLGYVFRATSTAWGLVALMEREKGPGPHLQRDDYKLVAARKQETAQKELSAALGAGYRFLEAMMSNEFIIVLGRQPEIKTEK